MRDGRSRQTGRAASAAGTLFPFLVSVVLGATGCKARDRWAGPAVDRHVLVMPFQPDSDSRAGKGRAVAESLVVRLGKVAGLDVRLDTQEDGSADFTIRGEIASRDGRLVVATRLHPQNTKDVLWTATFWRRDLVDSALVSDLTTGLAEAIYGQIAREATSARKEKP